MSGGEELRLADTRALVGSEDESAVADHRTARREPKLVLLKIGFIRREEVARVEGLVAQIFPCRSVDLVRAGARGRHEETTPEAPVFRAEIAGQDFEFLNGVGRRQIKDIVLERVFVRRAVETDLILCVAAAGDDHRRSAARLGNCGRRRSPRNSRHNPRQFHGIASIQRQLLNPRAIDHFAHACGARIDTGRLRIDADALGKLADRKRGIDARVLIDLESDSFLDRTAEACPFDGERVEADGEIGDKVFAQIVSHSCACA